MYPLETLFIAAEFAAKIGCKRQYVSKVLRNSPAAGEKLVRGVMAAAWSIGALPSPLLQRLLRASSLNHCATPLEYMQSRAKMPVLPSLSAIAPDDITRAQKLQSALAACLQLPDASVHERARIAAADYAREFGRKGSNRHLRSVITEVINRDGGQRQFGRLELYVAKSSRRSVVRSAPVDAAFNFDELENAVGTVWDRSNPTISEVAYCWRELLKMIQDRIAAGDDEQKLKRQLRSYIVRSAPFLGPTPAAAKRNINLKLRAAIDGGGIDAISDGRICPNRERPELVKRWNTELMQCARYTVNHCGNRESQAYRQLHEGTTQDGQQFSDEFRAAFPFNVRTAKSEMPKWFRAAMRPLVKSVRDLRLGPHAARLALPSIHRDWSGVLAGASYTSDDVTLNHYVIDWNDQGEFEFAGRRFNVCRPQFLPVVDERSSLPLGFSLIPARAYNSRHIRTLMTRICMRPEIGLPFEHFAFERGIWGARNVEALAGWSELDESFARFGVQLSIRHATTPKAKVIEQVIGTLQNLDEYAPGYIGRGEQSVKHERVQQFLLRLKRFGQPRKAEVDPREMLMTLAECEEMLVSVMERFANEPQNGKRLAGLSPAEGWEQLSGGKSHVVLPDSLRYLLGTSEATRTVTNEGIELPFGRRVKRYYCGSAQLGALVDEKVRVRYNEELPEIVTVTHIASDPRGVRPFSVPLFEEVPAHGATAEQFAQAREHQNRFASYGRALYREIAPRTNKTWSSTQLGSDEQRAVGAAHNRIEREHIEARESGVADLRAIRRLVDEQTVAIDPSRVRKPHRVRRSLEAAAELEAKILAAERTESAA